jgi:hypothetical protein
MHHHSTHPAAIGLQNGSRPAVSSAQLSAQLLWHSKQKLPQAAAAAAAAERNTPESTNATTAN